MILPWSTRNKPWSISTAVELGFGSSILIGTANCQEEGVKPHNDDGHYDSKPLKGSTHQGDQMRYVLQKKKKSHIVLRIQLHLLLKIGQEPSWCMIPEKEPQAVKSVEDQFQCIWQPAGKFMSLSHILTDVKYMQV